MKRTTSRTFLSLVAVLNCLFYVSTPSFGFIQDYTPIFCRDRAKKFKLKSVAQAEEKLKKGATVTIAGAKMHLGENEKDDNIYIEGVDSKGKPWKLEQKFAGLGTTFLTADLDKNGKEDIILLGATGGCGMAPSYSMTAITFDKNGSPFVFETFGYFSWQEHSNFAEDFLDLDGDGRAEIVVNELTSAEGKTKSRSFIRTSIYTCKNARFQLLKTYAGNKMPLVVRFTNKPNVKIIAQPPYNLTPFEDASSYPESLWKTGKITSFKKGDDDHPNKICINSKEHCTGGGNSGNYLFVDADGKLQIINADNDKYYDLLEQWAKQSRIVKYLPSTISGAMPIYIEAK